MRRTPWAGLLALLALVAVPAFAGEKEAKVEVKVMKYDDLSDLIKKNKGKVIVVDFWQDFCTVCKREMPKLIDLKTKYGDDLIAITVNLDDPNDPKLRERNEKTLRAKKAANTINVLLDEKEDVWQKKLNVTSFPTIFVFNQEGKYEKRYPEDKENFDYGDVAQVVANLLKK
ncbi:MAG TPA: TlpA disulfide reductase family protein [Gemmataceae bacterium]|nr:TlpA disulfide reductase family protein [Gemmataceae bacterium]